MNIDLSLLKSLKKTKKKNCYFLDYWTISYDNGTGKSNNRTFIYDSGNGFLMFDFKLKKQVWPFMNYTDFDVVNEKLNFLTKVIDHKSKYRENALTNDIWKEMYMVKDRSMPFVKGRTEGNYTIESVPCNFCGRVLPKENIQIDHVIDAKATNSKYKAALKVLHFTEGCTKDEGIGRKYNVFKQEKTTGTYDIIDTYCDINFKSTKKITHISKKDFNKDRYKITEMGSLIFSIIRYLNIGNFDFCQACLNCIINLRPLCNTCNTLCNTKVGGKRKRRKTD